jgi:Uma2 family endonuclease
MQSETPQPTRPKLKKQLRHKPLHDGKSLSLDEFRAWASDDGFKYEWVDGTLKATTAMKNRERLLVSRLLRRFAQTKAYQEGGELLPETDTLLAPVNKVRIPDLAFFTRDELLQSEKGDEPIPSFVIEIISPSNTVDEVQTKLADYFNSGVQVVWEIFPKNKSVRIYNSLKTVKICTDDDVCSAAPALPDFTITPNQLFG